MVLGVTPCVFPASTVAESVVHNQLPQSTSSCGRGEGGGDVCSTSAADTLVVVRAVVAKATAVATKQLSRVGGGSGGDGSGALAAEVRARRRHTVGGEGGSGDGGGEGAAAV